MKHPDPALFTPIFIKTGEDMPWPDDEKVFYILADKLYLCRNHRFFKSCVPATQFPSELATQRMFLKMSYPKIPRKMLEQIVGFFDRIGTAHGAEAGVLLVNDDNENCLRLIVPNQTATVGGGGSGQPYPIDLHYEIPKLPDGLTLIGDVHSHVDDPAYASWKDQQDEIYGAGLHIVVGRIHREPPEFHIEATVDGTRFRVDDPALVFAGYRKRCLDVPQAWLDKVKVVPWSEYKKSQPAEIEPYDAPAWKSNSPGYDSHWDKK
jgi:hypothetical protein